MGERSEISGTGREQVGVVKNFAVTLKGFHEFHYKERLSEKLGITFPLQGSSMKYSREQREGEGGQRTSPWIDLPVSFLSAVKKGEETLATSLENLQSNRSRKRGRREKKRLPRTDQTSG